MNELTQSCAIQAQYNPPKLSERMKQRKEQLESELAKVNEALIAMDKHPEMAYLVDAVSRLNI